MKLSLSDMGSMFLLLLLYFHPFGCSNGWFQCQWLRFSISIFCFKDFICQHRPVACLDGTCLNKIDFWDQHLNGQCIALLLLWGFFRRLATHTSNLWMCRGAHNINYLKIPLARLGRNGSFMKLGCCPLCINDTDSINKLLVCVSVGLAGYVVSY